MTKPASSLNREFDSRIVTVSAGPGGITRPQFTPDGLFQKVYCLGCGKDGGGVTSEIPAFLRGEPGVIYICDACVSEGRVGSLPPDAISLAKYKEA